MKALSEPKPQASIHKVMEPSKVSKRKKQMRRQPIRPAIGSFYDIMHNHAGTSLFTRPLFWTALHMKLLNCHFLQLPPQLTPIPTPPSSQCLREVSRTVISITKELNTLISTDKPITMENTREKDEAINVVLTTLYPDRFVVPCRPGLGIRFGPRHHARAAGFPLLWYRVPDDYLTSSFGSSTTIAASRAASPDSGPSTPPEIVAAVHSPPILVFVSRRHTDYMRKNCLASSLRGSNAEANGPVLRLQALRAKEATPKNADEDPYYFGIMVAMAQRHVYASLEAATDFKPRDVKVHVLAVAEHDAALIVYTGIVPAALLSMFHEPDTAPSGNPLVIITHSRVPVWPALGLKERLGQALGPDLVGHYDDRTIDTFHETVVRASEPSSLKRKREDERPREILSEVFNDTRPIHMRTINEHWKDLPEDLPEPPRTKRQRVGDMIWRSEMRKI
ncbi:hypothetical protein F4679DRAFT_533491 [Xylaria curta]|nr:hypothetical protein F4679DRAFT_533491 [Xylaria curta]